MSNQGRYTQYLFLLGFALASCSSPDDPPTSQAPVSDDPLVNSFSVPGTQNGYVLASVTKTSGSGEEQSVVTYIISYESNAIVYQDISSQDDRLLAYGEWTYDDDGKFVFYERLLDQSEGTNESQYTYGVDNTLSNLLITNDVGSTNTSFSYNVNGKLSGKVRREFPSNELLSTWDYSYSSDGKLQSSTLLSGIDQLTSLTATYFLNESSQIVRKEIDEGGDGSIDVSFDWSYDENGNLTSETEYNSSGELVGTSGFQYIRAEEPLDNYSLWRLKYLQ